MWSNPHETADLVALTEEILNGKAFFVVVRNHRQTSFLISREFKQIN